MMAEAQDRLSITLQLLAKSDNAKNQLIGLKYQVDELKKEYRGAAKARADLEKPIPGKKMSAGTEGAFTRRILELIKEQNKYAPGSDRQARVDSELEQVSERFQEAKRRERPTSQIGTEQHAEAVQKEKVARERLRNMQAEMLSAQKLKNEELGLGNIRGWAMGKVEGLANSENKYQRQMGQGALTLAKYARFLGPVVAGVAAVTGALGVGYFALNKYIHFLDRYAWTWQRLSYTSGLSTNQIFRADATFSRFGLNAEKGASEMANLNQELARFQVLGKLPSGFRQAAILGFDLTGLQGQTPEQQLRSLSRHWNSLNREKRALFTEVIGAETSQLLEMERLMPGTLKEVAAETERSRQITERYTRDVANLKQEWGSIHTEIRNMKLTLAGIFDDPIAGALGGIRRFIVNSVPVRAIHKFGEDIENVSAMPNSRWGGGGGQEINVTVDNRSEIYIQGSNAEVDEFMEALKEREDRMANQIIGAITE